MPETAKTTLKLHIPPKGEKTKKQSFIGDAIGMLTELTGFGQALTGRYRTYRLMRNNPTIALARAVATVPLRAASWSIGVDEDFEDDVVKNFIQREITGHWKGFLKNILFALDYGWAPFEKVWGVDDEGRWVYKKLKPLLVDQTAILVDKETGVFIGFRNVNVELPANKCFLYTYDKEAGNLYGRSRHENIRESAWTHWAQVMTRYGKYMTKVSGIIPMIQYPEGQSQDATGNTIDNFDIAKKVLQNLGSGYGVTMPNTLIGWAEDAVKSGIDIDKLKAWIITFLETKGQHGTQFVATLRHIESLIMRGWLVPERAATEGQHGTKAESKVQGDLGMRIADLLFEEILEAINWYVVNPLLIYNFGPEYENKVRLERAGTDPMLRELLTAVMQKVLSDPGNIDLLTQWIDIEAVIDSLSLPKASETIETKPVKPTMEEEAKETWKRVQDKLSTFVK